MSAGYSPGGLEDLNSFASGESIGSAFGAVGGYVLSI